MRAGHVHSSLAGNSDRTTVIQLTNNGHVATFTLPGGQLDRATALALTTAIESLAEDRALRVFAIVSGGSDFCSGSAPDLDPIDVIPDPASLVAALRMPVVVAIQGSCHGVGLELALAADIRISSTNATFRLGQVEAGMVPCWGGTQRLPRAIRPSEATAMVLLGTTLNAQRAMSLGLVHTVTDDVPAEVRRVCEHVTALGPLATELAKEAVHRGSELPLRDGLRLEADLNHQLASTEDRAEALAAFFTKRPPDFAGR
jgi:enoyl-CoA hydratase/carnithine racemase